MDKSVLSCCSTSASPHGRPWQTAASSQSTRFAEIAHQGSLIVWFDSYPNNRTQTFELGTNQSGPHLVDCSEPQDSVRGPQWIHRLHRRPGVSYSSSSSWSPSIRWRHTADVSIYSMYRYIDEPLAAVYPGHYQNDGVPQTITNEYGQDRIDPVWCNLQSSEDQECQPRSECRKWRQQTSQRCPRSRRFAGSRTIDEATHHHDNKFVFLPTSSCEACSSNSWSRDHSQSWLCVCFDLTILQRSAIRAALLQRVQNAATRLINGIGYHDHIAQALQSLHWLSMFRELHTNCDCSCTLFILDAVQRISLNWSHQYPSCLLVVAYVQQAVNLPSHLRRVVHHVTPSPILNLHVSDLSTSLFLIKLNTHLSHSSFPP